MNIGRDEALRVLASLRGRLIVSCQARRGQPFDSVDSMVKMAQAAASGGAAGIRADSPEHVRAIKAAVGLPMIGVYKRRLPGRQAFITLNLEDALEVSEAGAEIVGIECTFRDDRRKVLPGMVEQLKVRCPSLLMAEISTFAEAAFARSLGFDLIATTLAGYTEATAYLEVFDYGLLERLVAELGLPVIAEGRLRTPAEAVAALRRGAYAVVVGKAITMPSEATRWFAEALRRLTSPQ